MSFSKLPHPGCFFKVASRMMTWQQRHHMSASSPPLFWVWSGLPVIPQGWAGLLDSCLLLPSHLPVILPDCHLPLLQQYKDHLHTPLSASLSSTTCGNRTIFDIAVFGTLFCSEVLSSTAVFCFFLALPPACPHLVLSLFPGMLLHSLDHCFSPLPGIIILSSCFQ